MGPIQGRFDIGRNIYLTGRLMANLRSNNNTKWHCIFAKSVLDRYYNDLRPSDLRALPLQLPVLRAALLRHQQALLVTSPLSAKIWQHRIQPTAPAAPISTRTGTIRGMQSDG